MAKFKKKPTKADQKKPRQNICLRKQQRKQKRVLKKENRRIHYNKNSKSHENKEIGQFVKRPQGDVSIKKPEEFKKKPKRPLADVAAEQRVQEKQKQERLALEMEKHRRKNLIEANEEEDKVIKKLEKQLKLNKMKAKNVNKSFAYDGLDYLLEVCDKNTQEQIVAAEKQLANMDGESDFEEDIALVTGKGKPKLDQESDLAESELEELEQAKEDEMDSDDGFSDLESDDLSESEPDEVPINKQKYIKNKNGIAKESLTEDDESEMNGSIEDKECEGEIEEHECDEDEEEDDEDEEEDALDDMSVGELTDEEVRMLYSGVMDFSIEEPEAKKLETVYEESESDIERSTLNIAEIPKTNMSNDNSVSDSSSLDNGDLDSDNDMEGMNCDDDSDCSSVSSMHDEEEFEDEMEDEDEVLDSEENELDYIIVNSKIVKTYGRPHDKSEEPCIVRCPILDKYLESISDNESESPHVMTIATTGENKKKRKSSEKDGSGCSTKLPKTLKTSKDTKEEVKSNQNKSVPLENSDDEVYADSDHYSEDSDDGLGEDSSEEASSAKKSDKPDIWEDIYGRKRDKEGNVLKEEKGAYVPPHLRAKTDNKDSQEIIQLKRQIKGVLNKLAGGNMHWACTSIEALYNKNSRHAMNSALGELWMSALLQQAHAPDRMLVEHVCLIAVLHANVGTEVGAHFLQTLVKKFDEMVKTKQLMESKEFDNLISTLAQLYGFKIFQASLLYEILNQLLDDIVEKHVDCVLAALRNVGGVLRKEEPLALKEFIHATQAKVAQLSDTSAAGTRIKFLLEVLMAIKNNNLNKIPNYDPSYAEELKKHMRTIIRKGNYVTPLNISLEDLLKADERGKWWVVGSAWQGSERKDKAGGDATTIQSGWDQKLVQLARKQRMNTDVRRNIFCIIMSAEDYMDAFEKLQQLGLKQQQEREVLHVLLACCLQERTYNPYYSILAQKYCDTDRKYQMSIQYSVWDKIKDMENCTKSQIANLAQFLTHLFVQKGLPLSVLKIIEFSDLCKSSVRLMRQILLAILLHEDLDSCVEVFKRISVAPKLHMFRESLRLFIQHFLVKNADNKKNVLSEKQTLLLKERTEHVNKVLQAHDSKIKF